MLVCIVIGIARPRCQLKKGERTVKLPVPPCLCYVLPKYSSTCDRQADLCYNVQCPVMSDGSAHNLIWQGLIHLILHAQVSSVLLEPPSFSCCLALVLLPMLTCIMSQRVLPVGVCACCIIVSVFFDAQSVNGLRRIRPDKSISGWILCDAAIASVQTVKLRSNCVLGRSAR